MGYFNFTKSGLLLFIIGNALVLLATIPILFLFGDFLVGSNLAILLGLAIFGFIGVILYLIAYIFMCIGGIYYKEYGDKHKKFMIFTLIIILIVVVIAIVQAVYQMSITMSIASTVSGSDISSLDLSPLKNIFYFQIVTAIFSGLFYVFLLHELEEKIGKFLLYIAYSVSILTTSVIVYLSVANFDTWAQLVIDLVESQTSSSSSFFGTNLNSLGATSTIAQELSNQITKYSVFGIIPGILWLIAMILPFYRMQTGKFPMKPRAIQQQTYVNYNYPPQNQMQPTKKCPKCGSTISASSKFCINCGEKLN